MVKNINQIKVIKHSRRKKKKNEIKILNNQRKILRNQNQNKNLKEIKEKCSENEI